MAFFYCYQPPQHQSAQPVPQLPQSTTPELNTPLPPLFLLSPGSQQQNFTLPLLTPVLPSVSLTTTAVTTEHDDQQQLPTPNTFIRHCEDMGIFHDLQNMIVMSPSPESLGNTVTSAATVTSVTINMCTSTTSSSKEQLASLNVSKSLSNSGLKMMDDVMMDNPFDKTFKQAVLQQQKKDSKLVENHFNNSDNTDGELNTPFIATTIDLNKSAVDISKSDSKRALDLVTTFSTVKPNKQNSTFIPLTTEATCSSVLEKLVEKKKTCKSYSTVFSLQRQHQNHFIIKHRPIAPTSMMTTSKNTKDQNFNDEDSNKKSISLFCIGSKSIKAKQVLKQNLLEKQQLQERLRPPVLSEKYHELKNTELEKNNVDVVSTTTVELGSNICINDDNQIKKKQALLERNRTAAQRSRKKRKERWEQLINENRKLKIENNQLRKVISKLIGRKYTALPHQLCDQ